MKSQKKIEIIIESVYMNRLLDLFSKKGINAYTIIIDIEGRGGHGLKTADNVTDVNSNNYIFTVCDEDKLHFMIEDVRSFIKKYGGKCIITDVMLLQ